MSILVPFSPCHLNMNWLLQKSMEVTYPPKVNLPGPLWVLPLKKKGIFQRKVLPCHGQRSIDQKFQMRLLAINQLYGTAYLAGFC